nr:uncharacterized protein LOC118049938 isoform X2 [Populus alba]
MGVDYITVTCAQTESKIQFRFRFIFLAITALSSLVSRLIFSATAHLLVLIIQGCRLPGQAVQGGLQVLLLSQDQLLEVWWKRQELLLMGYWKIHYLSLLRISDR